MLGFMNMLNTESQAGDGLWYLTAEEGAEERECVNSSHTGAKAAAPRFDAPRFDAYGWFKAGGKLGRVWRCCMRWD